VYGAVKKRFPGLQFVEHFSTVMGGCPISRQFEKWLIDDPINRSLFHE